MNCKRAGRNVCASSFFKYVLDPLHRGLSHIESHLCYDFFLLSCLFVAQTKDCQPGFWSCYRDGAILVCLKEKKSSERLSYLFVYKKRGEIKLCHIF